MKITIVGTGYVGLSNAMLLAQQHTVTALDIDEHKINQRQSPIDDKEIENFLARKELDLFATTDKVQAYADADYILIATPTNYDTDTNCFDTSSVEAVINDIMAINADALIIIKSTIPVGFTQKTKKKLGIDNLSLLLSFCEKVKRCMIICIRHASSLVSSQSELRNLRRWWEIARLKRILISY